MIDEKEELLILGNGFDVNRKLKTTYADFMASKDAEITNNLWINILKKAHVKDAWYDVERTIKDIILDFNPYILEYMIYLVVAEYPNMVIDVLNCNEKGLEKLKILFFNHSKKFNELNGVDTAFIKSVGKYIYDENTDVAVHIANKNLEYFRGLPYSIEHLSMMDLESFIDDKLKMGNSSFDKLLETELRKFEHLFTQYLQKQDSENEITLDRGRGLISRIIGKIDETKIGILCFNYTNPIAGSNAFNKHFSINNVHGTLKDDNIIFGIDLTETNSFEQTTTRLVPFTKTYRKMKINTPEEWKLPKNPEYIRAYGHSLSSADYSYFQTIFDYVNLYESNTVLEFCFSIYGVSASESKEIRKTKLENNQVESIYQLINTYGHTLDNKDKGKNLLHKLLVENRLKIREV